MEKQLKYQERLLQSDQEKVQEDVQFQVEQAKLQLDADLLATKQSLADSEKELNNLKSSYPLNPSHIIKVKGTVSELKKGIEELVALQKELF